MKRDWFGRLFLVALIIAAGALVGVTRFPNAAWVAALSRSAVFGPWIEQLADLYRHTPAPDDSLSVESLEAAGVDVVYRIDLEKYEARPMIWLPEGADLHQEPSKASKRLSTVDVTANVKLFERQGQWFLVRHRDTKGWVHLPRRVESSTPVLGSDPLPTLPVPSRAPDSDLLELASGFLAEGWGEATAGPYGLRTDVTNRSLLDFLDRVASQIDGAYSNRYGITPLEGVEEIVVLFASEARYREFRRAAPGVSDLDAPGFVQSGVVATFVGQRAREEILGTLIHELTHLVNRRALGPALPPWLEEGLASDLGQSAVQEGRIVASKLGGSFERTVSTFEYRGGRAAAIQLKRALDQGTVPSLETLVELDWPDFQSPDERARNYAQASFFVRCLLDPRNEELSAGFRTFLGRTAKGRPIDAAELEASLGRSWGELDARLASFVRLQVVDDNMRESPRGSSSRQAAEPSS